VFELIRRERTEMHSFLSKAHFFSMLFVGWTAMSAIVCSQQNPGGAKAPPANLVRPEYYVASDYFANGQTSQAAVVYGTALSQSRSINNQAGIDSIPPLIRLGECFLEQCDIGLALERYDAALQITILHSQRWTSLLKQSSSSIRPDTRVREVPWAANIRGPQMGTYNEEWPIELGSNDILLESNAAQGVAGKMVAIDALEILRCQAIGLRRRYQLLGPLAKHNPLSAPLLNAFSVKYAGQSEAIQAAMNICRALAAIGTGDRVNSAKLIAQNVTVSNGLDHPLTAIALLALADLAIDSNDIDVAEERAMEATIVAGRAGQMDHLAEATEYLAKTGFANGQSAVVAKTIQQILQWSITKKIRMVNIRSLVELARLNALVGELELASKQCVSANSLLLPKQVVMPRAEAAVRYSQARVAFLEGNVEQGIEKLVESLAYLRGNEKGIGSPTLFQLDLALQLTKDKVLPGAIAETVLTPLLRSPPVGHWRVHLLEQLDWLMIDKSEAINLLLDIQLRTRSGVELVGALDEVTRKRVRRFDELKSRVMDLKLMFYGDNRFVTNTADLSQLRKQIPIVEQNVAKAQQLLAPLQANPKWDLRKWSEDDTRRWESTMRLASMQESLLLAAATSPMAIPEVFPPSFSQETLTKSLQPTDAVVLFTAVGTSLRGYLWSAGKWRSWDVMDRADLNGKTKNLYVELMALKKREGNQDEVKRNWLLARRIEIRNQLFPKEVWANLLEAERWIVVPDASVWYLPLETLPLTDTSKAMPCLAEHRITYSPTLGLVPYLLDAKPQSKAMYGVDVHVSDFLAPDGQRAKELREDLAAKKRLIADVSVRPSFYPPSQFFKIASDSICTFAPMNWETITPIASDANPIQSDIRSWSQLPWGSPQSLVLAGVNVVSPTTQVSGDEWLRLTLPLIAQGTRQITISRWPVGGESTASLLRSFHENQEDLSVSEAWQRSVLTLWEEQFEQRHEPLFKGAPLSNPEGQVTGSHPLLWSGFLRIGDSK